MGETNRFEEEPAPGEEESIPAEEEKEPELPPEPEEEPVAEEKEFDYEKMKKIGEINGRYNERMGKLVKLEYEILIKFGISVGGGEATKDAIREAIRKAKESVKQPELGKIDQLFSMIVEKEEEIKMEKERALAKFDKMAKGGKKQEIEQIRDKIGEI